MACMISNAYTIKPAAFHWVLPWLLLFTLTIGIAHYWEPILETVTAAEMEKKRDLPLMSRQHDDEKLYFLSLIFNILISKSTDLFSFSYT
jgi:hypothetical protein